MTNEELTILILDKLEWDYDRVVRKARANSTELLAGDLIFAILEYDTVQSAAKYLNKGSQTLNRALDAEFMPLFGKLNGGNETWKYKFLNLIEYKTCSCCKKLLSYSEFHKTKDTSSGIVHYCKSCRVVKSHEYYVSDNGKEAHAKYYSENYHKFLARNSVYKDERSFRVPKWSQTDKINEFYKNCPSGYHVDHIIPLKGTLVSGLHVIENLQYLTAEDNITKSNKYLIE